MILYKKIKKFQDGGILDELKAGTTYWTSGPTQVADAVGAAVSGLIPFSEKNVMNVGMPSYLNSIKDAVINNESINAAVSRDNDAMNSALMNNGVNTALMFGPALASSKVRAGIADSFTPKPNAELVQATRESNQHLLAFYKERLRSLIKTSKVAGEMRLSKTGGGAVTYVDKIKDIKRIIRNIEDKL